MSLKTIKRNEPTLNLGVDEHVQVAKKPVPKYLFGGPIDLPNYEQKRKLQKEDQRINDFVTEVCDVLEIFTSELENKKDARLVLFCCNQAENYFTKSKCGEVKKKAVLKVCKKYLHDEEIIESVIETVMPLVIKSTLYSRTYMQLNRVFLAMVKYLRG